MSPRSTDYKSNSFLSTTQARINPTPATAGQRWRPPNIMGQSWENARRDIDQAFRNLSNSLYSTSDTAQMNPAAGDLITAGSIPPSFCPNFAYTSDGSSITWTWTKMKIYRADGTIVSLRDGGVKVTGLSGTTTYYFYPFYDEVNQDLFFLNTPPGIGGGGGGSIAYSAPTSLQAQSQALQHRVPLSVSTSTTAMSAATTGGGGGAGSGGGR